MKRINAFCSGALFDVSLPSFPSSSPPQGMISTREHLLNPTCIAFSCLFFIIKILYTAKETRWPILSEFSKHVLKSLIWRKGLVVTNVDWVLNGYGQGGLHKWQRGPNPQFVHWAFSSGQQGVQGGPLPTRQGFPALPSLSFGISTSSPPGTGGCFAKARCAPLHSHRGSQTGSRALTWPTTQTTVLSWGALDPHGPFVTFWEVLFLHECLCS